MDQPAEEEKRIHEEETMAGMNGQMTLFSFAADKSVFDAGYTTEDERYVGRRISWSELCSLYICTPVWYKHIMESFTYYELVIPEKVLVKAIPYYKDGQRKMSDRIICYSGKQHRSLIDEWRIREDYKYPGSGGFYEVITC